MVDSVDAAREKLARSLASSLGFDSELIFARTHWGDLVLTEASSGVARCFAFLSQVGGPRDVELPCGSGLCTVRYLDGEGRSLGRGEWLVFGGLTPVPSTSDASCAPTALVATTVQL